MTRTLFGVVQEDGGDATQGKIADAAVDSDAPGTVNAHLRGIVKKLAGSLAVTLATLPAGTNLLGKVGIDQATANANEVVVKSGTITTLTNPLAAGTAVIGKVRLVTAGGDEVTDDAVDAVNVRLRRVASGTYASAVSVGNTATLIVAANANRIGAEVHHQGTATARVWLGVDNTLTAGAAGKNIGYLDPGDTWERFDYTGAVYGRTEAGTAYVSSLEV